MSISYHDHDQEYGQMYCHKTNQLPFYILQIYLSFYIRVSNSDIGDVLDFENRILTRPWRFPFCKLFFPHHPTRTLWYGINSLYILTQCIVRQSEDKCPSSVSPETLPSQSVQCCILVLLFLFHRIMKPNDRRCYITKCVTFKFCILWNFEKEFIYQKNWMYLLIHIALAFNSLLHFAKIKFYPHKNILLYKVRCLSDS